MGILPLEFFDRPTVTVARDLIGCNLALKLNGKTVLHQITETEAYDGPDDLACHAAKGRTKRTEILFLPAGHVYVYFCYGIHWMLNFVTGPTDYPSAVLIRGIQTLDGSRHFDGPAKLTKALGITGTFNGGLLGKKLGMWVEGPAPSPLPFKIKETPRIGIDYAGPIWSQVHYRFVMEWPKLKPSRSQHPLK